MRKIVIFITLIVLCVAIYLGRGFLPSDQLKQDILLGYVASIYEMQFHIDEAVQHYENGESDAFIQQINMASHYSLQANSFIADNGVGKHFEVPIEVVGYHRDAVNLASLAVKGEVTEEDIESLKELNRKILQLKDTIGTFSQLSNEYTPSSKLLDRIISGIEKTF